MPMQISEQLFVEIAIRNFNGETLSEIAEDLNIPQPRISEMKQRRQERWEAIINALTNREIRSHLGESEGALLTEEERLENYQIGVWVRCANHLRNEIIGLIEYQWCKRYPNRTVAEQRLSKWEIDHLCIVPSEVLTPRYTRNADGSVTDKETGETTRADGTITRTRPKYS